MSARPGPRYINRRPRPSVSERSGAVCRAERRGARRAGAAHSGRGSDPARAASTPRRSDRHDRRPRGEAMNVRRIPGTAVESSLRLVRLPLDAAVDRLPGNGTGARPTARLALDRADAAVRAFAGTILGDSVLREDAQMRRVALEARERGRHCAAKLRIKPNRPMHGWRSARIKLRASAHRPSCARKAGATKLIAHVRRRHAAPSKSSARAWQPAATR